MAGVFFRGGFDSKGRKLREEARARAAHYAQLYCCPRGGTFFVFRITIGNIKPVPINKEGLCVIAVCWGGFDSKGRKLWEEARARAAHYAQLYCCPRGVLRITIGNIKPVPIDKEGRCVI